MAICELCRKNVLESKKTWDHHHINTDTFNDAADSDCTFCRKLGGFIKALRLKPRVDPFYRWTMRETAQIRETKSYISITFRPVSSLDHEAFIGDRLPEVRFDMFPEEDLGPIPSAESFGDTTDSEASRRQMKTWLHDCIENHPKCKARHPDRSFMPTRVLDIGVPGAGSPSHIRVVQTKEETIEDKERRYMTLSHCWGKSPFVQLTAENLANFASTGIPWENPLSETSEKYICSNKNFSEAITIARDLGIRYIWIDSVCIIQNDTDDWEAEAKLMHKVYRNSYCNLAAADSKDCHGGLFRVRANDVLPTKFVSERFSRRFSNRRWRIVSSDLWDRELLGSPLYTRGWVFQERMLSPRLLQFGRDQLFWDCATISACEALPAGFPLSIDEKAATDRYWRQRLQEADISVRSHVKVSEGSLEKLWKNVVRTYTSCNLTKHSDKSNALWGIAKLSRDILCQEYAHGLWSSSLEEQLAWRVAGGPKVVDYQTEETDEKQNETSTMTQKTPQKEETSFPSWSWTYLDVPIQVVPRFRERHRFYKVTDHVGGSIGFQFETPYRGWLPKETVPLSEKFENMAIGPDNGDKYRKAQLASTWRPDERSKLISDKIPVQGHICRGTLISISGKEGWVIAIDGIRVNALIEAFPDIQPSHNEILCEFLVLAVSGVKFDELGCEIGEVGDAEDADDAEDDDETEDELDDDEVEYDELEDDELEDDDRFVAGNDGDIHYSGVGILVKRVGVDQLMRFGAVAFRQVFLRPGGGGRPAEDNTPRRRSETEPAPGLDSDPTGPTLAIPHFAHVHADRRVQVDMDAYLKQQVPSHKDGEQDSISWHSTRTSPPGEPPCATKMQEPGSWKEKEITFRRIRVFILSVLTCASVWWWIVRASPVNFRLTTGEMKLNDGRSGLSAVLAAAVGAFFAGPVASASSGPYTPFEPIDPQNWVNPDNMTWDDWVKPPGTDWSNPARKGSNRNFNIALVVVDYPDRNFTISQPAHSTIFSNPQPAAADVAREKVPTFYRDLLNTPNDLNQGHTLHEYWMEDSAGRFGVDLTAFGAYQLPANGYQYGVSDDMNPGACPTGETCNLNIRTDALSAWRNDVGNDTADAFELVFILSAGQDESSTWQEFGEMKFDGPEDVPDEFGPPKTGNTSLPNWARTRYVPWTSWAAASTLWPNAGGGSSTQGESSGMAVYAHELSHLLDIGDNYNNPYGTPLRRAYTGIWSMMSRGSFNGPGGPHTRWQIPALQGSSMGSLHTLRDKYQLGLIERPDILWLSREALATSGIAVADLTARSVDPGDGLMGIRIIMDSDRSPACDIQTEPLCDGGSWDNYDIEVVDRMGSDSFTPDSGVLISKSKNEDNQPFQWVIDAHPEDIELVDFHRPNGSIAMITMGDYRQLADALFHAGTNSGSEFEFIDEANDLHFYIIDRHRNDDGVLSYTVAVRSIGGEGGASVHDVSLEEGQVTALEQNTATTQGVSCSFQLSNSGAYVAVDPNDAQHPEDVSAFLASDVYRLSAEVEGAGWRVEVPNALVTAKFGEVKTAFVSVGASADAADAAVVTLKATSESDPSVAATAQCKVSKA